jgi:type VI secretion system protein ImpL
VIYVLFALLAALGWALWFILQLDLWIPLLITGLMALTALVFFIVKAVRTRRAANALEAALAEQGKQQVMNARPEKRAEIQALQKQITDGINALKASKLGGKKRGGGALYSLPWYAIIGPPGAGKTTALRHSGLVFPYADSAVRGVGGTRNCDWWFTNEAILLDTAGRYATESADQSEWLAFLDMLRRYRTAKPLNGLIVAVSITDVIDANEQQLEAMGKKLRTRIDEVMTRLKMVLPVYFLVTKCDLIAGFIEFFGDLRKSERSQAWGATVNLKENKTDPGPSSPVSSTSWCSRSTPARPSGWCRSATGARARRSSSSPSSSPASSATCRS